MTRLALGLDIGGTNIKLGLVSDSGALLETQIVPTPQKREPADIIAASAASAKTLLAHAPQMPEGVGIAAAGVVDLSGEHVVRAPNFPTWRNAPLKAGIEHALGLPAVMGNDVDLFGLAELRWGAAIGLKHVVCAAVGTGLGGAIIIDGKLYHGAQGGAAELGFTIIRSDGPIVAGCKGVIEGFVGRRGFDEIVLELFPTGEVPTPRRITELAEQGDPRARQVHDRIADYLAEAAASWLHILNPEALVLGGGTLAGSTYFFETFERKLRARARPTYTEHLKILPGKLGYFAGVQGAAALWFEH
jgi:predicted NBD/HSP70 family sugar kinase